MIESILKYINPQFLIIGGALLGIFGSYLAYIESKKESDDSKQRDELNNALSIEIKKLSEANNEFAKQNLEYSKILKDYSEKNEEIINKLDNKTDEINIQITGGKNIPKLFVIASNKSIFAQVRNDKNEPVKNVSVKLNRVIFDYFISNEDGTSKSTDHPNASIDYEKKFGDLQSNLKEDFFREVFPQAFEEILCIYEVRWQNGTYTGGFKIKHGKIEEARITIYEKGYDLKNAVWINGEYSEVK